MDTTVATQAAYLALSIAFTIWVGRSLARNGRAFLAEVFGGNERLIEAVNRLLVLGFYLVNLGFVTLFLRVGGEVRDLQGAIESLSAKLGVVLLVLGVLHLLNVYAVDRIQRHLTQERAARRVTVVA